MSDELLKAVMKGEITRDKAVNLLTIRQLLRHAYAIPLANTETGEALTVESDSTGTAYDKFLGVTLHTNNWDVDYDAFADMMDTPKGKEHFESILPRINREVRDAMVETARRYEREKARERTQTRRRFFWISKAIRTLLKLLRFV